MTRRGSSSSRRRVGIFLPIALLLVFSMYLVYSLVQLQVVNHEAYAEEAAKKHYRLIEETPIRGSIVDRNGIELAGSGVTETIGMTPSSVTGTKDGVDLTRAELAAGLAAALDLDVDTVRWLFTGRDPVAGVDPDKIAADKSITYALLKKRISTEESDRLHAFLAADAVSGITVDREVKRYYPEGNLAPQVVGFTSQDGKGLLGLELQYNDVLSGTPGFTYVETDNYYGSAGLPFSVPTSQRAQDGLDLVSTIDARIQRIAAEELQKAVDLYQVKQGGVAIVMDPYTGDVLAMVSCPSFDLNDPTAQPSTWTAAWDPTSTAAVDYLSSDVWRNRAISDTYEPGSTFKAITASIAFDENLTSETVKYNDAPIQQSGWTIQCWRQRSALGNHGIETLQQGFWNSCNPVFVHVSQLIGIDRFYRYVKAFGFESTSGIDLPGEGVGIFHQDPALIDMYSLSFGEQSNVTPISLLDAYNAFANGGLLVTPRMVSALTDSNGRVVSEIAPEIKRRVVSEATAARIRAMLKGVVLYGTGSPAYVEGYSVAGKTSTSNTATEKVVSFCAMAPSDQPVVTVLVVLNAPSSQTSSMAASTIAAKIISSSLETLGVPRVYTDKDQSVLSATVSVPSFKGKTLRDARKAAIAIGLSIEASPSTLGDDAVIQSQNPVAGTPLHKGGGVGVSDAATMPSQTSVMPDLTGKTASEVVSALFEAGLNPTYSSGDLLGLASSQGVPPGTTVARWSRVVVAFTRETVQ